MRNVQNPDIDQGGGGLSKVWAQSRSASAPRRASIGTRFPRFEMDSINAWGIGPSHSLFGALTLTAQPLAITETACAFHARGTAVNPCSDRTIRAHSEEVLPCALNATNSIHPMVGNGIITCLVCEGRPLQDLNNGVRDGTDRNASLCCLRCSLLSEG